MTPLKVLVELLVSLFNKLVELLGRFTRSAAIVAARMIRLANSLARSLACSNSQHAPANEIQMFKHTPQRPSDEIFKQSVDRLDQRNGKHRMG